MSEKTKFYYEACSEQLNNYGVCYTTYGIFLKKDGETIPVQHDVTVQIGEAERICGLLNKHGLDPEQAKYVIEDCIVEKYLV
ncbi:MAG: hypothetical protein K2O03_10280 [Lachnospiraceae bacterium]|nr:hypothetical protein [Lachnospiraceae bacterium]